MSRRDRETVEEVEEDSDDEVLATARQHTGRPVFQDDNGKPLYFRLHRSIHDPYRRKNLQEIIESNGGKVTNDETLIDTLLVDERRLEVQLSALQESYNCDIYMSWRREIWVENFTFLRKCIRQGKVTHDCQRKKGMGGRPGDHRFRVPFTEEDVDRLCRFLALKTPDKTAGGRKGLGIYRQLWETAAADPENYSWVKRHPVWSWQEHYKKHEDLLDPIIDLYVQKFKPTNKVTYHLDRRVKRKVFIDLDSDEDEDETTAAASVPLPQKRARTDTPEDIDRPMHTHSPQRSYAKGKEPARSPEVVDVDILEDLGSDDRYDIFGDLIDPVGTGIHAEAEQEPSFPDPSQITLVGSPPSTRRRLEPISGPFAQRASPPLRRSRRTDPQERRPSADNNPHLILARKDVVQEANMAAETVSTHTQMALQDSNSSGDTVHHRDFVEQEANTAVEKPIPPGPMPRALMMARRPKNSQQIASLVDDPPYRHTRSRSRSIEPPPPPQPPAKRKQKGKNKVPLEPLAEEAANEGAAVVGVPNMKTISVSRSVQEERSVEEQLNATTEGINSTGGKNISSAAPLTLRWSGAAVGMNEDDEQTDRILRQPPASPSSSTQHPTSLFNLSADLIPPGKSESRDPILVLKELQEISSQPSRRSSVIPSTTHHSTPRFTPYQTQQRPRVRTTGSPSSTENYPLLGTKAYKYKEAVMHVEKTSPYKAPRGTRAAEYQLKS